MWVLNWIKLDLNIKQMLYKKAFYTIIRSYMRTIISYLDYPGNICIETKRSKTLRQQLFVTLSMLHPTLSWFKDSKACPKQNFCWCCHHICRPTLSLFKERKKWDREKSDNRFCKHYPLPCFCWCCHHTVGLLYLYSKKKMRQRKKWQ